MESMNLRALYADESCAYRIPLEAEPGDCVTLRFRTEKDDVDLGLFHQRRRLQRDEEGIYRGLF